MHIAYTYFTIILYMHLAYIYNLPLILYSITQTMSRLSLSDRRSFAIRITHAFTCSERKKGTKQYSLSGLLFAPFILHLYGNCHQLNLIFNYFSPLAIAACSAIYMTRSTLDYTRFFKDEPSTLILETLFPSLGFKTHINVPLS